MDKVLLVGGNDDKAIESYYNEAFNQYLFSRIFPSKNIFNDFYNHGLINKLRYKIGLSNIESTIGSKLKRYIEEMSPDVVIVFKGMRLSPSTIEWISNRCFLVMYNPDHPFIYSGAGSGNKNMSLSHGKYDLYLTYAKDIQKELDRRGIRNDRIPFGYNLRNEQYNQLVNTPEIKKLCFLGNGDEFRANVLNDLANRDIPVVVYGSNWEGRLSSNIVLKEGVYGLNFWRVMRKYRVQLNIMRPHNLHSHNMRTFDIPAVGGVQLAPDTPEHREFFNDSEISLYHNTEDCYTKAKSLLDLSDQEIANRRRAARERCLKDKYSYHDRAKQMLDVIDKHYTTKK